MTLGMVGFGALLFVRHRLRGCEPALADIEAAPARRAGRVVLCITAMSALLVLGIIAAQLVAGGAVAPLSLLMPAAALLWLLSVGLRSLRHAALPPAAASNESDRPSRRPPDWTPRSPGMPSARPASDGHARA